MSGSERVEQSVKRRSVSLPLAALSVDVTGPAKALLLALCIRATRKNQYTCWPSFELLAKDTGASVRTAKTAAATLREAELIDWIHEKTESGWRNLYLLNVPAIYAAHDFRLSLARNNVHQCLRGRPAGDALEGSAGDAPEVVQETHSKYGSTRSIDRSCTESGKEVLNGRAAPQGLAPDVGEKILLTVTEWELMPKDGVVTRHGYAEYVWAWGSWIEVMRNHAHRPALVDLTASRAKRLEQALNQIGTDGWRNLLAALQDSDYLMGKAKNVQRRLSVDLDWLLVPSHFARVLAGEYAND